jgi:DMSO/TMAO reductase YedYZ molybdopterin-dependent catalytic subunit
MQTVSIPRREFLAYGSAAIAGWTALHSSLAWAFPARPGEEVISWADQPPPIPDAAAGGVQNLSKWEDLNSWLTPNERFFSISHYNRPVIDERSWSLQIGGSVAHPLRLTLDDIKARPRREVVFTLECSGNHGFPWFTSAVGNARWAGTPLAPILEEAQLRGGAREVVFFGTDAGEEEVRKVKVRQNFARSMSLDDAMSHDNILAYEMNGAPLPQPNGFPLRLIAPGWYGIANVKWLDRIEARDSRFMGRFQARDYVTLREEQHDGKVENIETSVGRSLLKSAPAKVTRQGDRYRIVGAAWGAPIAKVEVQIDDGPWIPATIDRSEEADNAWRIWSVDWDRPSSGEHRITSRATDFKGNVQPAMNDPWIANKRTYWESNGQITRSIRVS